MTVPPRPRRPLPRRVYWVRRLVVLAVLAGVVLGGYALVTTLVAAWQGVGQRVVATPVGAEVPLGDDRTEPSPTGPQPSPSSTRGTTDMERGTRREPLPEPEGTCPDEDVVVRPSVTDAHVGTPIRVVLEVSTRSTPACTWQVSPGTVFLRIGRGAQGPVVWSSQQCPSVMPTVQVVARQVQPAEVVVSWSGRMSDAECSTQADWVLPGRYRAESIARGAVTPLEERFRLQEAVPEVVYDTPTPSATGEPDDSDDSADGADAADDR